MGLGGYRFLFVLSVLALLHISAGSIEDNAEIQRLKKESNALNAQQNKLFTEINGIELEILNAQRILSKIYDRSDNRALEIANLKNQLNILNREKKNAQRLLQKILIEEYKNRDYQSKLYFLASSENLNQFVNRLTYLKKLKRFRVKQLRALDAKQEELKQTLLVYTGSETDKEHLATIKRQQIFRLNELMREKHKLYSQLEQEEQKLTLAIKVEQQNLGYFKKSKPKTAVKANKGLKKKFSWPVKKGVIIERFGVHKHKQERKVKVQNNGLDILVSEREAVKAIDNGKVKSILQVPGYNTSVIVDHGGYYSVYANLNETYLQVGDSIKQGVKIATAAKDNNGVRKLHFELWNGIDKLNPEKYLHGELD